MNTALTLGFVTLLVGLQSYWVSRSLDTLSDRITELRTEVRADMRDGFAGVNGRLDKLDERLRTVERAD